MSSLTRRPRIGDLPNTTYYQTRDIQTSWLKELIHGLTMVGFALAMIAIVIFGAGGIALLAKRLTEIFW